MESKHDDEAAPMLQASDEEFHGDKTQDRAWYRRHMGCIYFQIILVFAYSVISVLVIRSYNKATSSTAMTREVTNSWITNPDHLTYL